MPESIIDRFHHLARADAAAAPSSSSSSSSNEDAERFIVRAGTMRDYEALARHHYRGARPGTATSIFAIEDRASPRVIARFRRSAPARDVHAHAHAHVHEHKRSAELSSRDAAQDAPPVGVLVRSYPALSCRMRDLATRGRYAGLDRRAAAALLNREVRVISRVVIDPRYRGQGLAVRLVRYALAHPETVYTEAIAAMGRVNPFFERAGMTRYDPPARPEHVRLRAVMDELRLAPTLLASESLLRAALDRLSAARRAWFESELRRWAGAVRRLPRRRRAALAVDECLALARRHLFSEGVYYLFRHESEARP